VSGRLFHNKQREYATGNEQDLVGAGCGLEDLRKGAQINNELKKEFGGVLLKASQLILP